MSMSRRMTAAGVAGVLGAAGLAVAVAPVAGAATSDDGTTVGDRLEAIKDALAGLVSDGTLTQEQADRVADVLDDADVLRGPHGPGDGGHGHGSRGALDLEVAAQALGLTTDELRSALVTDGSTLADVAEAQGVDVSTLVGALVDAATERLAAAVDDGRLTQAEADERAADLIDRITTLVEEGMPTRGPGVGHGHRGRGPRGWGDGSGATDGAADGEDATSGTTDPTSFRV